MTPTARRPARAIAFDRPAGSPDDAVAELRTVRDLLRWGSGRLLERGAAFGQGTDDPWDEAAWLLLWSLRLAPQRLEPVLDARVTRAERAAAIALIERRCDERLPAAYLTGEAWLRGVRFRCDARALVPRSPIAELLDGDALAPWLPDPARVARVLDLCTGGGSLAILAALAFPAASVVATDLSADALALAAENVAMHGLADRITLHRGALWAPVPRGRFDLIVCNPPYVNARSMAALPAEFRHEPQPALAGGDDGMDLVRPIVAGARSRLADRGLLLLEVGHERAHFEAAFPGLAGVWLTTAGGGEPVVLIERDALP